MNRFNEDELLAFILFAFDFNYYLNKKSEKEKKILMSPLPNSLSKLSFKLLDIKDNDYVLNFYSELGNFPSYRFKHIKILREDLLPIGYPNTVDSNVLKKWIDFLQVVKYVIVVDIEMKK